MECSWQNLWWGRGVSLLRAFAELAGSIVEVRGGIIFLILASLLSRVSGKERKDLSLHRELFILV